MSTLNCNIGDRVRCTGTVSQADGTPINPAVVKGWYKNPATGTVTTLQYGLDSALVRDNTGVYHFDLDVDVVGRWFFGFYSTGTGKASSEDGVILAKESKRL